MLISIMISEEMTIKPGEQIPGDFVSGSEKPQDNYLLAPGDVNPSGEEVLITGVNYLINYRAYDLSSGHALVGALRNGIVTPKLRDARLNEKYAFQKTTAAKAHKPSVKYGPLNTCWPIVAKTVAITETSKFVDKALDVISESVESE